MEEDTVTRAIAVVAHYDNPVIWMRGATRRTVALGWEWPVAATCLDERHRTEYFAD